MTEEWQSFKYCLIYFGKLNTGPLENQERIHIESYKQRFGPLLFTEPITGRIWLFAKKSRSLADCWAARLFFSINCSKITIPLARIAIIHFSWIWGVESKENTLTWPPFSFSLDLTSFVFVRIYYGILNSFVVSLSLYSFHLPYHLWFYWMSVAFPFYLFAVLLSSLSFHAFKGNNWIKKHFFLTHSRYLFKFLNGSFQD